MSVDRDESNSYIFDVNASELFKRTIRSTPKVIFLNVLALALLCFQDTSAQGSAGSEAKIEPRSLIDVPTAGILAHKDYALDVDFYEPGGLLMSASFGILDRLFLGISFGGREFIGSGKPEWNSTLGVTVRVRFIEETLFLPAVALGFDTQGKGAYVDALSRYSVKSLGFYAVVSKNYRALGYLSLHGGVNYSLERGDGDSDPNFFVGAEKTLGPFISLMMEYNLGLNDSNRDALGRGRGYLNAGTRISLGNGLTLGLNLKDIIKNQDVASIGNRTVVLEYVRSF